MKGLLIFLVGLLVAVLITQNSGNAVVGDNKESDILSKRDLGGDDRSQGTESPSAAPSAAGDSPVVGESPLLLSERLRRLLRASRHDDRFRPTAPRPERELQPRPQADAADRPANVRPGMERPETAPPAIGERVEEVVPIERPVSAPASLEGPRQENILSERPGSAPLPEDRPGSSTSSMPELEEWRPQSVPLPEGRLGGSTSSIPPLEEGRPGTPLLPEDRLGSSTSSIPPLEEGRPGSTPPIVENNCILWPVEEWGLFNILFIFSDIFLLGGACIAVGAILLWMCRRIRDFIGYIRYLLTSTDYIQTSSTTPYLGIYKAQVNTILSIGQRLTGIVWTIVTLVTLLILRNGNVLRSFYLGYFIIYMLMKTDTYIMNTIFAVLCVYALYHIIVGIRFLYLQRTGSLSKYKGGIAREKISDSWLLYAYTVLYLLPMLWILIADGYLILYGTAEPLGKEDLFEECEPYFALQSDQYLEFYYAILNTFWWCIELIACCDWLVVILVVVGAGVYRVRLMSKQCLKILSKGVEGRVNCGKNLRK